MQHVKIKNTSIEIAPINLGGNVFGWTLNEKESFNILDKFVAAGFNFIDTANIYSYWVPGHIGGESETIIGNWMKKQNNRKNVVIATKVGAANNVHPKDNSRKHIMQCVEESLKRLQTDYIDLYYTHFDDEKTPVIETLTAYDELVKAGKVRYIAASNMSPQRLEESIKVSEKENIATYVALQPHYNLLHRNDFETNYTALMKKYNLSVFPYFSLASGFLTGKYRTKEDLGKSPRGGDMDKHFNTRGYAILDALDKIAAKHDTTQASVALAWLLANPLITAPIASATKEQHLQMMLEAVKLKLDKEDIVILNDASSLSEVKV